MKQPQPKRPTWWPIYAATAAACAAITAAAYLAAVRPALEHRQQQRQLDSELAARREKSAELAAGLAEARRHLQSVHQALADSRMQLQPAALVNDRLERLADLANQCGLAIDEVQPGGVTDAPHFQVVSIKLAGTGAYPACTKFLHLLHDSFPDTGVRSLETSNNSPNPLRPVVSFRLELTWYAAPAASVARTE